MPKKLTINGKPWDVPEPFQVGQPTDEAQAKVLNQTFAENVGNNLRKKVTDLMEAGKSEQEIQAVVTEYANSYNFSMGGGRAPVDPFEKMARTVARQAIKEQLESEGRKLKDIPKEDLEAEIERIATTHEGVQAEARKRVKAAQKKVQLNLGGLFGNGAQASA
jgi:hypothetical protein